ncbi:helix-turn-helix domain-containing protein [Aeromicrobium alkaliterrae]|uniref:Helix-turn-helix domain-containing protein n=1 Tax=Aeromicrobium alkaliterrae TaxID=302168 RepID=A0ABN2JEF2_9ACTN
MNVERNSTAGRAAWHAALADVARLQIVDRLTLTDLSPSELQASLGLPSNLVAHHLKVLQEVGIVDRRRSDGDRRRTYLTLVDRRAAEGAHADIVTPRVVFVCSANSARSQLAAAHARSSARVEVASAGTAPAAVVAPGAVAVARRHGLTLDDEPQAIATIRRDDDFIVAVCDQAYEELGGDVQLHWSLPDPVSVGTDAAFESAYARIVDRLSGLVPRLAPVT